MTDEQYKEIQDGVNKSVTETQKASDAIHKMSSLTQKICLGVIGFIIICVLAGSKGCQQQTQRATAVQQPAIITETRRVTDMEFCAPVMINGSQYRASTVPDIPIIVRINGDRIVHLKRESEGGTVDLGSGINTLEYKADGPYIATVSVDIKHW